MSVSDSILKEETYHIGGVGWGSVMCELFHYVLMTHKRSNMDRRQPRLQTIKILNMKTLL